MSRKPISQERIREIKRVDGKIEKRPSEQEMHERRIFVRSLHAQGFRTQQIVEFATVGQDGKPPRFRCEAGAIVRLVQEIRGDLQRELETFLPAARASGLERLYGDLTRARLELQQMRGAAKKDYGAIRGHMAEIRHIENQIAKMEGTLEPIRVQHSGEVTVNLQRAVGSMTPEQYEQAIRAEERRVLELQAGSITVNGEEANPETAPASPPAPGRRRPPLPAAAAPNRVGRAAQAPVPGDPVREPGRKERASDVAARREVRSGLVQDVEAGARPRGIGARVLT